MFRAALRYSLMARTGMVQSASFSTAPQLQAQAGKDPVQEIFVTKIREYANKQKSTGEKLVEATADTKKTLEHELALAGRVFKITDEAQAEKFPALSFSDPGIDPINLEDRVQETKK